MLPFMEPDALHPAGRGWHDGERFLSGLVGLIHSTRGIAKMASLDPRVRNLEPEHGLGSYYEYRERWAVLVGISKHQHAPWNLNYARRDAEELAKLLRQAAYGAFEESRMCVLLDEDATTAKITKALRSFLRRPAPNDLVLIHFSCHGTPDPDGLDEVYLVTHDTDPADIAATALPMREVRYALEHTLKAERVVTLADTCHSAALVSGGRRLATPNAQVMKQYLQAIGGSKKGRAWLMSAEANEVSLEDARWGGGHGLFTHQLIEGLKGKADTGRKGLVKVGDLFDFVYDQVIEESGHKQHPSKGVEGYDRELVLAVTAHLQLREHFELGYLLERMGWLMDDPRRFESASRQLDLAFNLAADNRLAMPEAAVRCGLSRLAVADGEHALSWFDKAEKSASEANPPDRTRLADARFHRPLALLDLGRPLREPLGALDQFLAEHAGDSRNACAREMRERIARGDQARRRALLIGVGQFQDSSFSPLIGPENDIRELRKVLIERFAFGPEDVTALEGQVATRAVILEALDVLAQQAGPEDVVVVYFSGHGIEGKVDPYWVAYDALVGREAKRPGGFRDPREVDGDPLVQHDRHRRYSSERCLHRPGPTRSGLHATACGHVRRNGLRSRNERQRERRASRSLHLGLAPGAAPARPGGPDPAEDRGYRHPGARPARLPGSPDSGRRVRSN